MAATEIALDLNSHVATPGERIAESFNSAGNPQRPELPERPEIPELPAGQLAGMTNPETQLIRELHATHSEALAHFVIGLVGGDRFRAQDVVQETFLRAWRNPSALRAGTGPTRSWLFTVARRIVIDDWRSRSRHPEALTAERPETERPETERPDEAAAIADRQVLIIALRTLSYPQREVLLECYFRGYRGPDGVQFPDLSAPGAPPRFIVSWPRTRCATSRSPSTSTPQ